MLTLENIEDRQMRENIKTIQVILPWTSVVQCRNALLESTGTVDGACIILSDTDIILSVNEDNITDNKRFPVQTSETSGISSYEIISHPVSGLSKILLPSGGSTSESGADKGDMVEIILPDDVMLGDLRETVPGVFSIPVGTKFSCLDNHRVRTSPVDFSDIIHDKRDLQVEKKQGEAKHKRGRARKAIPTAALQSSQSTRHDISRDMAASSYVLGDRTTRSIIHGSCPTSQQASSSLPGSVYDARHPFNRNQPSAEDKERLEFTASAVIRATCMIEEPVQSITRKEHEMWSLPFKTFAMSHGLFNIWQGAKPVNDGTYIGTNRGRFLPSLWINSKNPSKRGFLQTINVQGQYKNSSFEELRLGDYVRKRIMAPHLFSLFRKLPVELRLIIWKFALTSRVVELRFNTSLTSCWTKCPIPVLFQVCRESRLEALKSYQLSFGLPGSPPIIYFAGSLDTLFLTFEKDYQGEWASATSVVGLIDLLEHYNRNDLHKIQNLAIDEHLWICWNETLSEQMFDYLEFADDDEDDKDYRPTLYCLPSFTELKTLIIVRNLVEGYWKQGSPVEDEYDPEDFVSENVEFLPLSRFEYLGGGDHFCECSLKNLKIEFPEWSMPALGFLEKIDRDSYKDDE